MNHKTKMAAAAMAALTASTVAAQTYTYPFQDPSLSFHERAKNLVSLLTLEEKINQVGHQTLDITRLGVSGYYYWNEALHGVARSGLATSFPSSKGMSATWNPELVYLCAEATSDEARVYNNTNSKGLTYWCPTINMSRDPRWGRDEENYGEDPYLTSRLAVEYIRGMQGDHEKYFKTVATAKHFAANNYEKGRHTTSSDMDERNLREYYLPAFEAAVKEANVRSVMSAYNALNGIPCGASHELLIDILRGEWGFDGFVTSDCGAVDDVYSGHNYVDTPAEASAISMINGEDLNCGSTFQEYCMEAIESGLMTEADLDTALTRVFEARFSVGEFDDASLVPWRSLPDALLDCQAHRDLAYRAAQECIVLLKNDDSFLPLDTTKSVAVIGPLANIVSLGGYSGSPTDLTSPLDGICAKLGYTVNDGTIECESFTESNVATGSKRLTIEANGSSGNVGYIYPGDWIAFDNVYLGDGRSKVALCSGAENENATTVSIYLDSIDGTPAATVTLPVTGDWASYVTTTADVDPQVFQGTHKVYLSFSGGDRYCANMDWIRFYNEGDDNPWETQGPVYYHKGCAVTGSSETDIEGAVAVARKADVVVFVAGTNLEVSDEGNDRTSLTLPGDQQELLEAVWAANPNVVLLLQTCSSMDVTWAEANVPAIVEAWYGGQAQGKAIADVLYGDYNPGGKLTSTWYASINDLPSDMLQYDIRANHYTYMYYDNTPLYPFGFGLSYTTFDYSNLGISQDRLTSGDSLTVTADIKNTGSVAGTEIVQLYVHAQSAIERPQKELKGFARVELAPGETKTVSMTLRHDALAYFNDQTSTFEVEEGTVDILIGASSADIRLTGSISTEAATVKTTYKSTPTGIRNATMNPRLGGERVYTLQGQCVGTTDNLGALPAGIYVTGGRKVAVGTKR